MLVSLLISAVASPVAICEIWADGHDVKVITLPFIVPIIAFLMLSFMKILSCAVNLIPGLD